MPTYDYECLSCGHRFELKQSFDADPNGTCPLCEGEARRKFHPVPVIYKGSGFYTTDYGRRSGRITSDGKDQEKEEAAAKKEKATSKSDSTTKATTTKSEEKSETKAK